VRLASALLRPNLQGLKLTGKALQLGRSSALFVLRSPICHLLLARRLSGQ
jgi:hypothetical protein